MIKIESKANENIKIEVEMPKELEKQLRNYLAVGKHFKMMHRKANLNDLVVVALTQIVNSKDYLDMAQQFEAQKALKKKAKVVEQKQQSKANEK